MRILMLSDFYYPLLGGVEQHVRSLSHALLERGHEVAVATLRPGDLPERELDAGVRVYRINGSAQRASALFASAERPWAPPFPDPELTWKLRRVVADFRPDIVHGHDWLGRSFLPLKRRSGAKLVTSLHYYTLSCAKKSLMREGRNCAGPKPLKCLSCAVDHYGAAKGVPVISGNLGAARLERRLTDRYISVSVATTRGNGLEPDDPQVRHIPNFLPPAVAPDASTLEPYVAQLPPEDFMLFVGDLRRDKGLDTLLEAYRRLDDPPPLVLIGKTWPETPKHFPPGVVVLERWPNFAVLEAWRRSSLALVPSLWAEPFGIVVIEAMAGGTPVVASRIGGIPEIVIDGETGLLVEPGNPDALAGAIRRLLADRELAARMGAAGQRRAALYATSAVVPKIEAVYEEVIGRAGVLASEGALAGTAAEGRALEVSHGKRGR